MKTKSFASITGIALALAFVVVGVTTPALAAETPEWFYKDIVDVEFVKQHVKVPMAEDVMIIDARPKRAKYDKGHIPMAISIPDSHFAKMTDKLPKNKDALLIFYCGGLKCKLSHKSAMKAEKLGYTNIKVFAKGFPNWMKEKGHYATVTEDWLKKQMDKKAGVVIVDSRPKRKKYDKGHIPTAISISDTQFKKLTDRLPAAKDTPLVFYCGGFKCKLSHKSAKKAIDLGYTKVKVFAAGYPAWKAKFGAGTVAAKTKSVNKLKAGAEEGSINLAEFNKIVAEKPESVFLVDVRDPDEFAGGSLKTAVNIPVDKLEDRIKELPSDKPIVFICGTGARSGESYYMVQDLRPELKSVYYVEAEMSYNKDGSYTAKVVN
jgi:rhodanese-related sulfurtransferase